MAEAEMTIETAYGNKRDKRRDFDPTTRRDLERAAGSLCAHRGCLQPSTCGATKRNSRAGSATTGRAAHIYAAAPNGPRPAPPGKTDDDIKHFSNGIWMCADCAGVIDSLECEYSADQLFLMKRVRESAQKLAVSCPEVRSVHRHLSPLDYDEIFWRHLPDLDPVDIKNAVLRAAAESILDRDARLSSVMPPLPATFQLKPVASALTTLTATIVKPSEVWERAPISGRRNATLDAVSFAKLRNRAARIVDTWAEPIRRTGWNGVGWHIHHCHVKIAVRHPRTREVHETAIWVQGNVYARHDFTAPGHEVLRLNVAYTSDTTNNLDWYLKITVENGLHESESTLRLFGEVAPRDLMNPYEWRHFEDYQAVVEKLAQGWEPIGFVSRKTDNWFDIGAVDPEPFDIVSTIGPAELKACLDRCRKIRLARELQAHWDRWFVFTPDYFNSALDESSVRRAFDEVKTQVASPYWCEGRSAPVFCSGRWEIRLVTRNGYFFFERSAARY